MTEESLKLAPWQLLELKHALETLIEEAMEQAQKLDIKRYTRPRFVLELNFDPIRGTLIDSGIEIRMRRPLRQ